MSERMDPQYMYAIRATTNLLRRLQQEPTVYIPLGRRMQMMSDCAGELASVDLDQVESNYIRTVLALLMNTIAIHIRKTLVEAKEFVTDNAM